MVSPDLSRLSRRHLRNHPQRRGTIDRQFEDFHHGNPHIFESLRHMALDLKARGVTHYGIATLFEVLRWQSDMQTNDEPFKLNNNYRSRYARLLMKREPRLAGFFSLRELRAE